MTPLPDDQQPTHGELDTKLDIVLGKLEREDDAHTELTTSIGIIETCLVGDQLATPAVIGLVQRTVDLEDWKRSTTYWFKRLFWLGLVGVLGLFASLLWEVIRANLEVGL